MSNIQIAMLIFLFLYLGVLIGVRSYILFRQTKVNTIRKFGTKSKNVKAERLIYLGVFLMIVIGLNFCFIPENYQYFFPIKSLEINSLNIFGFIISVLGLAVGYVAQGQMKDSWRLGVDDEKEILLITTGMFKYSRNPIYVCLGIAYVGFFLIAPNWGSVLFLVLMTVAISKKVKDEEVFLRQNSPVEYLAYCQKVRRWL